MTKPKLADNIGAQLFRGVDRRSKIGETAGAQRSGEELIKVGIRLYPSQHKRLKFLAVERETTIEALVQEAVDDICAKYTDG